MSDLKKKNYVKLLFVKKTMVYAILMKVVYASVRNRKNRLFSDSDCNKTALVKMLWQQIQNLKSQLSTSFLLSRPSDHKNTFQFDN